MRCRSVHSYPLYDDYHYPCNGDITHSICRKRTYDGGCSHRRVNGHAERHKQHLQHYPHGAYNSGHHIDYDSHTHLNSQSTDNKQPYGSSRCICISTAIADVGCRSDNKYVRSPICWREAAPNFSIRERRRRGFAVWKNTRCARAAGTTTVSTFRTACC